MEKYIQNKVDSNIDRDSSSDRKWEQKQINWKRESLCSFRTVVQVYSWKLRRKYFVRKSARKRMRPTKREISGCYMMNKSKKKNL